MKAFFTKYKSLVAAIGIPVLAAGLAIGVSLLPKSSIQPNQGVVIEHNPAFDNLISAYTSGDISKKSPIRVRFMDQCVEFENINTEVSNPFSFSPAIDGTCKWIDTRTIEFTPDEYLPSGMVYIAKLKVRDVVKNAPDSLSNFEFQFKTLPQGISVEVQGVETIDMTKLKWQRISGSLSTEDFEKDASIEGLLTAEQDGKPLNITWEHQEESMEHNFVVDSIARQDDPTSVTIKWDGNPINVDQKGERNVQIRALGDFDFTGTYVYNSPEQYIVIEFSDPLQPNQNLKGLVQIGNYKVDLVVDGNKIKAYPKTRLTGKVTVKVSDGIKNIIGYTTKKDFEDQITFTEIKPEVRISNSGTIIPMGASLPFVFEAVSLSAVDVRVIQIKETNIPQFLQVNQLGGNSQLKRVGTVVLQKTVQLDKSKDLGVWNKHALDLSKLISPEPGAIYQVSLGYRANYSLYGCTAQSEEDEEAMEADGDHSMLDMDEEDWAKPGYNYSYSSWDYWEYDYDYTDRNDPCSPAYYHKRRIVSKNILASSLGLIAKRGSDKTITITSTDLHTTEPQAAVELEVYDYQQNLISKGMTDAQGMAKLPLPKTPFLLIAKKGGERGYLRLDDGNSLSLSRFDVAGQTYHKGIKGMWYGERGVWRPGDSLYLTFVLEDKLNVLPVDHPVTFEFRNPYNQLVKREVKTKSLNGFFRFPVKTAEEDMTGNYMVTAKVGGTKFSETIKVETIMPNRLKIEMDFDEEYITNQGEPTRTTLKSKWLHGATADGLKADVTAVLTQSSTNFRTFNDYEFDDPSSYFESEQTIVFDGKLDENGEAEISADISISGDAPGMLMCNMKTKVYEPGGNFSVDRFKIPFHPYDTYVGLKLPKGDKRRGMLLTDTNHTVRFVTLDPKGETMANRKLSVKLYKLSWEWWWSSNNDISHYNGMQYTEVLQSGTVTTNSKGEANWTLRVNYPEWGRYFVRVTDEGGHSSGKVVYIDWPGWAGRPQSENPEGAKMLTFSSDKEKYTIGEDIVLSIPTGSEGRALVSIESGTEVIEAHWVEATKGTTRFKFKASRAMAPNAYAHVTYLQPHGQTRNDLPMRMYGVIPVFVTDPATKLKPKLDMKNALEPNSKVKLKVSEENGHAMTYTIAVVDEGLLDLTRFKTPGIWNHFYKRQALGVKTWDMFDEVIAMDKEKFANLLAIGGGGELADAEGSKQNRFKPMVKFMGPFHLHDGQSKEHSFVMPNYVGSVRTMVVAGYDGAYGTTEKTTPVRKPLMVLGTLPRVLGPNEELELPVTVFAMDKKIKNAKVQVTSNDLVSIEGGSTKSVSFSKVGDEIVTFNLKVKPTIGTANIKIVATSGSEKAVYETPIEIRNPNPEVTDVYAGDMNPGNTWTMDYTPVGMNGTNSATLEVSAIPPMNLEQRLSYLIRYPYGCVEQTTSSVFPQLYVQNLIKVSKKETEKIDKNIQMGIDRLVKFQKSNGGLAYWPGGSYVNDWGTNYAGHFMLEASKAGYNVPSDFLQDWTNYQKQAAKNWATSTTKSTNMVQAYRLYLLAAAGEPELGAMNRLRLLDNLPVVSKWYLAAAYHLAGQPETASTLTSGLSTSVSDYTELTGTYGSSTRDLGVILLTMSEMKKKTQAKSVVQEISDRMSKSSWYSTQTTAYCLLAVAKYTGASKSGSTMKFKYKSDAGNWITVSSDAPIVQEDLKIKGRGTKSLQVVNEGGTMLFARVAVKGTPAEGDKTDAANNLDLSVSFKTMNGTTLNPASIPQGTDFMVEVEVNNPTSRQYDEMVLNQIFPSGWEIHNARLDGPEFTQNSDTPEYQDIRDDRVYTFFDMNHHDKNVYRILLNATYEGRYYLPTIYAEAMYDNTINARRHGQWVEVVKQ